jgi:class 3 adenylate cyclase
VETVISVAPDFDVADVGEELFVFAMCRAILCLGFVVWLRLRCWQRLQGNPRIVENLDLITFLVFTFLIFASYEALARQAKDSTDSFSKMTEQQIQDDLQRRPYHVNLWQLFFMSIYCLLVTALRLRFGHVVTFVVLSVSMMYGASRYFNLRLYNPHTFPEKYMFFCVIGFLGTVINLRDEMRSRSRWKVRVGGELASKRIEMILNTLMPPLVVQELSQAADTKNSPPAHAYQRATIAQSDLVGFTALASTRTAREVVEIIRDLFGLFDDLTDKYGIYKVETVGDAYIAGQAEPPMTKDHIPQSVVMFGAQMIKTTREWARQRGEQVDCRVGVHHGECVGGIVGAQMQRYHLFGKLLAELENLESTSPAGCVHVSKSCRCAILKKLSQTSGGVDIEQFLTLDQRFETELRTSKGEKVEYHEAGGSPTYIVRESNPEKYLAMLEGDARSGNR